MDLFNQSCKPVFLVIIIIVIYNTQTCLLCLSQSYKDTNICSDNNAKYYTIYNGFRNKWKLCSCIIVWIECCEWLKTEQNDIVAGIGFEAVVPARKKYSFNQNMIDFFNTLELNYQKYQTDINVRDGSYKVK